tara:strand:- start:1723 stop:1830 length:108 start_codon:yes stop_codon:yes gene_type:complete
MIRGSRAILYYPLTMTRRRSDGDDIYDENAFVYDA